MLWPKHLKSQTPSDGCMLVTIPFMCLVVSVHVLYTATSSGPCGRMSCSTVSDVNAASSPVWCAWMSCGPWMLFSPLTGDSSPTMPFLHYSPTLLEPLAESTPSKQTGFLSSMWGSLVQAFTVDDVFARKVK